MWTEAWIAYHYSIIISTSGLCLAICYSVCRKILSDVPTVSLFSNSYCNFRAYLQNRYMRYNMYSGRPCENSLQRRRVEKGKIYKKIFIRKYLYVSLILYFKVFQNSVLEEDKDYLFTYFTNIQVRKSRKEYCCAPLGFSQDFKYLTGLICTYSKTKVSWFY
jgi:hypothetical protein